MFTLTGVVARFFTSATTVGCVIALGAAATVIAGTILWIPYSRKKIADRALRVEVRAALQAVAVAEAAKFETLYWDEYDALLTATAATAAATTATANPVTEYSPQGDAVTMVYLPDRSAFGYYTDRKSSISYPQLETVARKYLVDNAQSDVAKQAYADRRSKTATTQDSDVVDLGPESKTVSTPAPAPAPAPAPDTPAASGGGGIFAMFRRYNRKPASASASASALTDKADAPLEYTRFVYLGSMHDYEIKNKNKRAHPSSSSSSSSSSASESTSDCDAIDYAEFKRLKTAVSAPEMKI
jgi:hypothetical protein